MLGRTASDMTTEEMEAYRAAWRRRQAAAEQAENRRAEHARTVAREAARIQGRLLSLSPGLAIDLVDVCTARPALRRSIETEGEAL